MNHDFLFEDQVPWYKKAVRCLLVPLVLPISVLVMGIILGLAGTVGIVGGWLGALRLLRQMRRRGRYLPWAELTRRIAESGGTLIFDNPTIGWNTQHLWWTEDDLPAIAPCEEPALEAYKKDLSDPRIRDWQDWCSANYTHPDTGRAFLICVRRGAAISQQLCQQFPNLKVVRGWSGYLRMNWQTPNSGSEQALS